MEKIDLYRSYIREIIKRHAHPSSYGDIEVEQIFDTENDYYLLFSVGWLEQSRQYGCLIHIDIKNDKIWIQYDGTEVGVANELVELGVPKDDIVLGYHSPYRRQFTGFALA